MARFRVLITDYAWPSLDIERDVLAKVNAEVLVAELGGPAELADLATDVDAILTCWRDIPPEVLDSAPRCKVVSRYGIGLDNIPVGRATELGILVTNVPDFCLDEVSDHTIGLLLACARRIVPYALSVRSGMWDRLVGGRVNRVRGQVLGLVGFGNIAQAVAKKATAFGLRVVAYTPRLAQSDVEDMGVEATNDLPSLLSLADYVSLHVPLTRETTHLIDHNALSTMKSTAYLINTSRGDVIDEPALVAALAEGKIAGAALDVLAQEPPQPNHPLLGLDNVIITPHAAFYSSAAIDELERRAAQHVVQVLRGELPDHVVNPEVISSPAFRLDR